MELKNKVTELKYSTRGFEHAENKIGKLEDGSLEIMGSNEQNEHKEKNNEKWTEPKRFMGHYSSRLIYSQWRY